ncbi:MAG: type II toxin-antitoxin system RelE/ParE family toxin [Bacteroidetes bacterium]|nr:type II toxin-antitoxin system RelE/ParE family toxin [Bacteroidota bacterium]MCL6102055.1 type II toxin-antitoxin system RelE/ParE family toxin [Bacteroidota bacterium]
MKKIIWANLAVRALKEIYLYHKLVAGERIAIKIKSGIFTATRQLTNQPELGQFETSLEGLGEGHRFLVQENYKIIYKIVKEGILVTDLFDTRQEPKKMNDPNRLVNP